MEIQSTRFRIASLIESWRRRFGTLNNSLQQSPEAEDAWLWTMQRRVIHFLLVRYDPGQKSAAKVSADSAAEFVPTLAPLRVTGFRSVFSSFKSTFTLKPPRSSPLIRTAVEEIKLSNQERYELLRQEREAETVVRQGEIETARAIVKQLAAYRATHVIEQDIPEASEVNNVLD